jgi:hypothetical protein
MQTYKITNSNNPAWSGYKKYSSLAAAELDVATYGNTFSVSLASESEQIPTKPARQKIADRKAEGVKLEEIFLYDNSVYFATRGSAVTKEESKSLRTKFKDVWESARLGSLEICLEELQDILPDAIISQERIDKYIAEIQLYLSTE